ncbi:hypothetical protein CN378_13720 [Bacillus sp. AFS015802]|nr:hypothetical protein CN378_13720 [Bacillus sp. AFS015802]
MRILNEKPVKRKYLGQKVLIVIRMKHRGIPNYPFQYHYACDYKGVTTQKEDVKKKRIITCKAKKRGCLNRGILHLNNLKKYWGPKNTVKQPSI